MRRSEPLCASPCAQSRLPASSRPLYLGLEEPPLGSEPRLPSQVHVTPDPHPGAAQLLIAATGCDGGDDEAEELHGAT